MQWLEIVGVIVGLVYLYLEYKANIWLWAVSIIMPAIYLVVFYDAGLYADTAINIYYLVIALYGWIVWRCGSGKEKVLPMQWLRWQFRLLCCTLQTAMCRGSTD